MTSPQQIPQDQLAGWACHALGPYLPTLMDTRSTDDVLPHVTPGPLPHATRRLWLCLTTAEFNNPYRSDIQAAARGLVETQGRDAEMQQKLFFDIRLALDHSPDLCAALGEIKASMLSASFRA